MFDEKKFRGLMEDGQKPYKALAKENKTVRGKKKHRIEGNEELIWEENWKEAENEEERRKSKMTKCSTIRM